MIIAEFAVIPVGGKKRLGKEIAKAIEVIKESGLPYELTSMGTIIQGPWDEVMDVIKQAHKAVKKGCGRAVTHIAIDDRAGAKNPIEDKVKAVEKVLKEKKKKKR